MTGSLPGPCDDDGHREQRSHERAHCAHERAPRPSTRKAGAGRESQASARCRPLDRPHILSRCTRSRSIDAIDDRRWCSSCSRTTTISRLWSCWWSPSPPARAARCAAGPGARAAAGPQCAKQQQQGRAAAEQHCPILTALLHRSSPSCSSSSPTPTASRPTTWPGTPRPMVGGLAQLRRCHACNAATVLAGVPPRLSHASAAPARPPPPRSQRWTSRPSRGSASRSCSWQSEQTGLLLARRGRCSSCSSSSSRAGAHRRANQALLAACSRRASQV